MGLFSTKATCSICGNEVGLNRFKIKDNDGWICPSCLKKAGGNGSMNLRKVTVEEIKGRIRVYEDNQEKQAILDNNDNGNFEITKLSAKEKLDKLIIVNPTMSLKGDEVCFYQGPAQAYHTKNVVTGYKGGGAGVSIRVAKGFSVHTGSGGGSAVRQTIGETYNGTLYITNERFVLLAPKYGFDIPSVKISNFSAHKDGFEIYQGAKCFQFLTKDVQNILKLTELMNKVFKEQSIVPAEKIHKSTPDMIREYKDLLDSGIITNEEFEAKKKQLLNI